MVSNQFFLLIITRHYPVGVLYDLYGNQELPWQLVVHFQGFPSDQLLRCPNEDTVKWQFMNVLKEANYIKHGDTSRVNGLTVAESNDIWDGVKQCSDVIFKI